MPTTCSRHFVANKKSFPAKHANEIKRSITFMVDLSTGICPSELFVCYQCITHLKITKLLSLHLNQSKPLSKQVKDLHPDILT
jgi:hypothetical protein